MPYSERGYLEGDFRLFHLRDTVSLNEIDYHYHEFHKALLILGGNVGYGIEGKHYPLSAGDVVLVPRGCVHKPEVGADAPYARYVLYLSAAFLRSEPDCPLDACFTRAEAGGAYVLRLPEAGAWFRQLEAALAEPGDRFGAALLGRLAVKQLLVALGRALTAANAPAPVFDPQTVRLLRYINDHLTGDVGADALAQALYVSKYHLMRRFREETGYSIHRYVSGKRLLYARDLLSRGTAPADACFQSGFRDYSAFARAYKKQFGVSPGSKIMNNE